LAVAVYEYVYYSLVKFFNFLYNYSIFQENCPLSLARALQSEIYKQCGNFIKVLDEIIFAFEWHLYCKDSIGTDKRAIKFFEKYGYKNPYAETEENKWSHIFTT